MFSSTTEYHRASLTIMPTVNYILPFIGHKIRYLSSSLVTYHQSSRLYGVFKSLKQTIISRKSQQFSSGPVEKNFILSGIACLYNKTQNFFNIITVCLKHVGAICFVVSGSARVARFTWLRLKVVTEPNSAEPTELTE